MDYTWNVAELDVESFVGGKWGWCMGWGVGSDCRRILRLSWKIEKLIYKNFGSGYERKRKGYREVVMVSVTERSNATGMIPTRECVRDVL